MTDIPKVDLNAKVAFVTGAGSGMGRATALAFAKAGASVAAADISEAGLKETVAMIEAAGGKVLPLICDVTKSSQVKEALDKTLATFGRLDAAHNNAGIEQPAGPLNELSEEVWDRVVAVNLKSVFLCMKYEIEIMLKQGGGAIVNSIRRWCSRHSQPVQLLRRQIRRCSGKQGRGPGKCQQGYPGQRRVPGHYRYADDLPIHE